MAKSNKTGRTRGSMGRFISLPLYMLQSAAWRSLSPVERCCYLEIIQRYNGSNNGRLAMSARSLALAIGVNRATSSRALQSLIAVGLIEVVQSSAFSCKVKRAAEYRVTIHRCDVTGDLPSKTFMRWQPENQNTAAPQSNAGCTTEPQSLIAT